MPPKSILAIFQQKPKTEQFSAEPTNPLQQFTLFTSLPPKLRLRIWYFVSIQPSTIIINTEKSTDIGKLTKGYIKSKLGVHEKPQHGLLHSLTPESNSVYNSSRKTPLRHDFFARKHYSNLDLDVVLLKGVTHAKFAFETRYFFEGITSRVKKLAIEFSKPVVLQTIPNGDFTFCLHSSLVVTRIFDTFLFLEELKFINDGVDEFHQMKGHLPEKIVVSAMLEMRYQEAWKIIMQDMDKKGISRGANCPAIEWVELSVLP